jgi:hypothetical protein
VVRDRHQVLEEQKEVRMKTSNIRNHVLAACLAGLCTISIVGLAYGQVLTPPDNCHCGPVDDCNGIPMQHSTYCPDLGQCSCIWHTNPQGNCLVGIEARCDVPGGS